MLTARTCGLLVEAYPDFVVQHVTGYFCDVWSLPCFIKTRVRLIVRGVCKWKMDRRRVCVSVREIKREVPGKHICGGGRPSGWWKCRVTEMLRLSIQHDRVAGGKRPHASGHGLMHAHTHSKCKGLQDLIYRSASKQRYPTLVASRCFRPTTL